MKFQLTGKIVENSIHNDTHTTVIMTPAPDSYSQPSSYKLKSAFNLGTVGDEITADLEMRGFIRRKNYNDKQTGQNRVFLEDNVILSVLRVQPKSATVKTASS